MCPWPLMPPPLCRAMSPFQAEHGHVWRLIAWLFVLRAMHTSSTFRCCTCMLIVSLDQRVLLPIPVVLPSPGFFRGIYLVLGSKAYMGNYFCIAFHFLGQVKGQVARGHQRPPCSSILPISKFSTNRHIAREPEEQQRCGKRIRRLF